MSYNLLLVRHAIAEDAEHYLHDAERPLSAHGRRKMQKLVLRLRERVSDIDLLVSSPLLRAQQTAAIIAVAFNNPPQCECLELDYRYPAQAVLHWLEQNQMHGTMVLVGHQPQLGALSGLLLAAGAAPLHFRKGAMAMLQFEERIALGVGRVQWQIVPGSATTLR